jgi:O-antigen/teichoic acid export membrane protein
VTASRDTETGIPALADSGRRIAAGSLAGWVQAGVGIAVSLLQVRFVLEFLPRELSGVWFLFLALAGYVALFDLGISPTLSREISFALGSGATEPEARSRVADLVATAWRAFGAIGLGVLGLSLAAGLWYLSTVAPPERIAEVRSAWIVFAIGATLNVYGNAALAAITGLGAVATERLIRAASQALFLTLTYLALSSGVGIQGLAGAWLAQAVVLTAAGWLSLRRLAPWLRGARKVPAGMIRSVMGPSLKWAATAFGSVLILETDNLVIARTMGTGAIPPYEVVAKLAFATMYLSAIVLSSSIPFLSRAFASGEMDQLRSMTLRNVRLGMGSMLIMGAWLLVYARPLIALWVGPSNFVGQPVVAVFVVMLILEAHHRFLATTSLAMGDLVFHWLALGAGVLNIVLTLLLVRRLGLLGVALGSMLAQLTTNNWLVPRYTLRRLGLPLGRYLATVLVPLLLVFGVAAGIGALARGPLEGLPLLAELALGMLLTGGAGVGALTLLVLSPAERRTALAGVRGLAPHRWPAA